MPRPDDPDHPVVREDEDDYDMPTFGQAGARLDAEIRRLEGRIRQLEAAADESAELTAARARLEQLRGAAARNARPPISDENFARFFGYPGKARRNTR